MSQLIEVKVPDIGDFKNIPVIEVLVKSGDKVEKEDSLITLESDKATMEVPSPAAGIVKELKIKPGDKLSEGSLILTLDSAESVAPAQKTEAPAQKPQAPAQRGDAPKSPPAPTAPAPSKAPAAVASTPAIKGDIHAEVVVLGSGPGGYTAAFRAADLGKQTVLIERYPVLGGVCLNVGCIPSKALLHAARVVAEAEEMGHFGLSFGKPKIELDKLRDWKSSVVEKSIRGLAGLAKQRKVTVVQGVGKFTSPRMIEVKTADGVKKVSFDHAIIAAGSQSAKIPGLPYDDPRLMDSTAALELKDIPKRLLVIGGGIIGLEMAYGVRCARRKGHRRGTARRPDPRRRSRPDPAVAEAHRKTLRSHLSQDEGDQTRAAEGRLESNLRRRERAGAAGLRPRPAGGRPAPQRQGN